MILKWNIYHGLNVQVFGYFITNIFDVIIQRWMAIKIETKVFLNKSLKRLKIVEGFSQLTLKIDKECNGLFA